MAVAVFRSYAVYTICTASGQPYLSVKESGFTVFWPPVLTQYQYQRVAMQ